MKTIITILTLFVLASCSYHVSPSYALNDQVDIEKCQIELEEIPS